MDWAKSETKGDPSGRGQYELGSNDGRPGGEPVRSILWFIAGLLGEEPEAWDIIPILVATRVRLATVAARSS